MTYANKIEMASIEMLFKKEVNRQALNISSKMLAIANVENLSKKLFLTLTVLAIGSGVATYIVFVQIKFDPRFVS